MVIDPAIWLCGLIAADWILLVASLSSRILNSMTQAIATAFAVVIV